MSAVVEVEVEDDVLAAAMQAAGESDPRELIERALREMIARRGARYVPQEHVDPGPDAS